MLSDKDGTDRMSDASEWHGWHLDKRVSIGHVVTTITVAASVMIFGLRLEGRVAVNEVQIANNIAAIEQSRLMATAQYVEARTESNQHYQELIRRLERISDQLGTKQDRP